MSDLLTLLTAILTIYDAFTKAGDRFARCLHALIHAREEMQQVTLEINICTRALNNFHAALAHDDSDFVKRQRNQLANGDLKDYSDPVLRQMRNILGKLRPLRKGSRSSKLQKEWARWRWMFKKKTIGVLRKDLSNFSSVVGLLVETISYGSLSERLTKSGNPPVELIAELRRKEKEIHFLRATLRLVSQRPPEQVTQSMNEDATNLPEFVEAVLDLVDDTLPEPAHTTRPPTSHARPAPARSSPPSPSPHSSHSEPSPAVAFSSSSSETINTPYHTSPSATSSQVSLDEHDLALVAEYNQHLRDRMDRNQAALAAVVLRPWDLPLPLRDCVWPAGERLGSVQSSGGSSSSSSGGSVAEEMQPTEPMVPGPDGDERALTPGSPVGVTEDFSRPGGRRIYRRAEGPPVWVERPRGGRGADGPGDV